MTAKGPMVLDPKEIAEAKIVPFDEVSLEPNIAFLFDLLFQFLIVFHPIRYAGGSLGCGDWSRSERFPQGAGD